MGRVTPYRPFSISSAIKDVDCALIFISAYSGLEFSGKQRGSSHTRRTAKAPIFCGEGGLSLAFVRGSAAQPVVGLRYR